MKIEKFLEKINYKIKYGEVYNEDKVNEKVLYWVFFTNKTETYNGQLLLSAVNKNIYLIKYNKNNITYFYKNKNVNHKNDFGKNITLKNMIEIIENN